MFLLSYILDILLVLVFLVFSKEIISIITLSHHQMLFRNNVRTFLKPFICFLTFVHFATFTNEMFSEFKKMIEKHYTKKAILVNNLMDIYTKFWFLHYPGTYKEYILIVNDKSIRYTSVEDSQGENLYIMNGLRSMILRGIMLYFFSFDRMEELFISI